MRAMETAVSVTTSQFKPDRTCRAVLIEAGKGEGSGDLNIRMGDGPIRDGETVEGAGVEGSDPYEIGSSNDDPPNPQGVSIKNAVRTETPL